MAPLCRGCRVLYGMRDIVCAGGGMGEGFDVQSVATTSTTNSTDYSL